jgi:hypothetical protein
MGVEIAVQRLAAHTGKEEDIDEFEIKVNRRQKHCYQCENSAYIYFDCLITLCL